MFNLCDNTVQPLLIHLGSTLHNNMGDSRQ